MIRRVLDDPRKLRTFVLGVVAVVAVLAYANSLANDFAYDDNIIIRDRELIHEGLERPGQLLTEGYWPPPFEAGLYRPVLMVSFALDWAIWNGDAFGFHLLNVLLHAGVTLLVTAILLHYFSGWAALAGGLVFAVHPLHTEAVANVVGRGELLAALFALWALLIYIGSVRRARGRPTASELAAIAVLYALACLTKESGIVLPGLVLVSDLPLAVRGRLDDWRSYIRSRVPTLVVLGLTLAGVLAVRWAILGTPIQNVPAETFLPDPDFRVRLFTMMRVWPRYLELFLLPLELSADYSPAVILPARSLTPLGALGAVVLGALFALGVLLIRRLPELSLAVAWAAVAVLPVSNILFAAEIVLAERTLYLPSVAVSFLAATALTYVSSSRRIWVGFGLGLLVVGYSILTVQRNPAWKNTDTIFQSLRESHPESTRLLWAIGTGYLRAGEWEVARRLWDRALSVWPHRPAFLGEYAIQLMKRNEYARADSMASRAARLRPEQRAYRQMQATARLEAGDAAGAAEAAREGLAAIGEDAVLYVILARARADQSEYAAAADARAAAARLRSEDGRVHWRDWWEVALYWVRAGNRVRAMEAVGRAQTVPGAPPSLADSLEAQWDEIR